MRNEDYFMPHFFAHYRALGVEHFVIYDDRSGEPTRAFLSAQPDCTVVFSESTFGEAFGERADGTPRRLGAYLKEVVAADLLPDRWVVVADADEFLILPPGAEDLPQFISRLEAAGQAYGPAPMVDFYGETLNHRLYDRSLDPFAGNPYFDTGPYFYWHGPQALRPFRAGIRYRLLEMLMQQDPKRVETIYGGPPRGALLWKFPLLRHGSGVTRTGDHTISDREFTTSVSGALAHFKFYPDLDAKIDSALAEGQYFKGSVEYQFLDAARQQIGDRSLISDQTRRYTGPQSLVGGRLL